MLSGFIIKNVLLLQRYMMNHFIHMAVVIHGMDLRYSKRM